MENIKKGGLNAQIYALWVNPVYAPHGSIKKALLLYHALEKHLFSPGYGVKVTSTTEMKTAIQNGKLACWLSLEGGHIIENSPEILELFYSLGIRCVTLTHTKNTDWADSSADSPQWDGLNKLGRKIITKMQDLHMIIDVSHASDKTVEDVLDQTSTPVMASHSNARAICDIPRNLPDDLIHGIAERNGFIGINFYPGFLRKKIYDQLMKNLAQYESEYQQKIQGKDDDPEFLHQAEIELYMKMVHGIESVDLNAVIDHMVYIAEVGGVECVGLGSDFDGIFTTPSDLTDASCYPALIEGLSNRGFNREEIQQIMGLNLLTFLKNFD